MKLYNYVLRRLLLAIPTIIALTIIIFLLMRLAPGDPLSMAISDKAPEQAREAMRKKLGLNKPLPIQYLLFLKRLLHGNLGWSIYHQQEVSSLLLKRILPTLTLGFLSLGVSFIMALLLGTLAALKRGGIADAIIMAISLVGLAIPQFWFGLILIQVFSVQLGWLPVGGMGSFKQLILPATALGAYGMALTARVTRSNMIDVLHRDFVRTARAKGLSEFFVVGKHALRHALNAAISVTALRIGWIIGGVVMLEKVFDRMGIGRLTVQAVYSRDYPVIMAVLLLIGISVISANLLADVLYSVTDPSVRYD